MNKLKDKSVFLLDMDGTIYLGDKLIDGALEFLKKIKSINKKYIFLTNNSSKNKLSYVEKLNNLGINASLDDIFTSGEATTIYLKNKLPNGKVFLLGTKELEDEFINEGFEIVKERNKDVDFVVLGFDTTLTYEKLWIACEYISEGVDYIATHPDFNCPLPEGKFMPDAGAMAAFIEASTGISPKVIGKPNKEMVNALLEKYSVNLEDVVMVGDRLYTDIKMGEVSNISTVLVYSGETTRQMYKNSKIQADWEFDSVKDMINII